MANLYFKNIDGARTWNAVANWFLHPNVTASANAPGSPATDDVWVETDNANAVKLWNGSAWVAGGGAVSAPWVDVVASTTGGAYLAHDLLFATGETLAPIIGAGNYGFGATGTASFASVLNNGTINGGTFSGSGFVNDFGTISNGTFSGSGFTNINTVNNGTFSGSGFVNNGNINGGTFSGVGFVNGGYINNGTFSGSGFVNSGTINNGTFSGAGFVNTGTIRQGTFSTLPFLAMFRTGVTFTGAAGNIILTNDNPNVLDILQTGML